VQTITNRNACMRLQYWSVVADAFFGCQRCTEVHGHEDHTAKWASEYSGGLHGSQCFPRGLRNTNQDRAVSCTSCQIRTEKTKCATKCKARVNFGPLCVSPRWVRVRFPQICEQAGLMSISTMYMPCRDSTRYVTWLEMVTHKIKSSQISPSMDLLIQRFS
jgi:hypothetical protein